jgi:hypothetical protein
MLFGSLLTPEVVMKAWHLMHQFHCQYQYEPEVLMVVVVTKAATPGIENNYCLQYSTTNL